MKKTIFRNYDIRGVYPTELNEEISELIGKALGTLVIRKDGSKFVIGRDNRASSEPLMASLIKGILSTGCSVTDIGLSLTPIVHFATKTMDFDMGIEVTASHNPKEYNGFRVDYRDAIPLYGEDVLKVQELILGEDFVSGEGHLEKLDIFPDYLDFLKNHFTFESSLKVALDCGNGTASEFMPQILTELGLEVAPLYCDSDANYPRGVPDPENLEIKEALSKHVKETTADIGVTLDPDADRFGFVDEKGIHYDNDKTLMLFADDILKEHPGAVIAFDVKCTGLLEDFITARGGIPKRIRTGHPYMMQEITAGSPLAGEFSGHIFFADKYFGYDDGMYAILRVIEKILESKRPLSYLMLSYPMRVHSSEIKLPCPDDLKFGLIDTLAVNFKELPDVLDVDETDGVRVKVTETGWLLIRASNTTPLLSVRVEGLYEKEAEMMLERVKMVLTPFLFVDVTSLDDVKLYVS